MINNYGNRYRVYLPAPPAPLSSLPCPSTPFLLLLRRNVDVHLLHFGHILGLFVEPLFGSGLQEVAKKDRRALVEHLFFRPRQLVYWSPHDSLRFENDFCVRLQLGEV